MMKKLIELTMLVSVGTTDVEVEYQKKGICRVDWETGVVQLDPEEIAYLILYGWEQFQAMDKALEATTEKE